MRRSLQSSSNAIDLMLSDDELFDQLVASKTDYEKIIKEIIVFDTRFVSAENTVLKKAGVSSNAKKILIRQTRNQRMMISLSGDYRLKLRNHLEETRAILNSLLEQLKDTDKTLEAKKAVQKDWRRISYLVGGAALVAIDTSLGVTQPAIAAVSSIFGTTMIKDNLQRKSRGERHNP